MADRGYRYLVCQLTGSKIASLFEYLSCVPTNAEIAKTDAKADISAKELVLRLMKTNPEITGACASFVIGLGMSWLPGVKNLYQKRILNTPITQGKIAQVTVDSLAQVVLRKYLDKEQSITVVAKNSAHYIFNSLVEDSMKFVF